MRRCSARGGSGIKTLFSTSSNVPLRGRRREVNKTLPHRFHKDQKVARIADRLRGHEPDHAVGKASVKPRIALSSDVRCNGDASVPFGQQLALCQSLIAVVAVDLGDELFRSGDFPSLNHG